MIVLASLMRALQTMLPDAQIALVRERPWYSLTFSGVQVAISIRLPGNDHVAAAIKFARMLPTHEFNLHAHLVADIAVIETIDSQSETLLSIAALILED